VCAGGRRRAAFPFAVADFAERGFDLSPPGFAFADEASRTGPGAVLAAVAPGCAAVTRLARDAFRARDCALVVVRAAARRALERWGLVRGRLASTPPSLRPPAAGSSLVFESATVNIIA
jgi:hypothetical protein